MVRLVRRQRRLAVAAKVRTDDREPIGQERRDPMPRRVRSRMSVQQEDRGAGAAVTNADLDLAEADPIELEAFEDRGGGSQLPPVKRQRVAPWGSAEATPKATIGLSS